MFLLHGFLIDIQVWQNDSSPLLSGLFAFKSGDEEEYFIEPSHSPLILRRFQTTWLPERCVIVKSWK